MTIKETITHHKREKIMIYCKKTAPIHFRNKFRVPVGMSARLTQDANRKKSKAGGNLSNIIDGFSGAMERR